MDDKEFFESLSLDTAIDTVGVFEKANHGTCECGWRGPIRNCETEIEQDGWENPPYTVHICPKCGDKIEYYSYEKIKLVVAYSTNRDQKFIDKYNKELIKSSGLKPKNNEIEIIAIQNNGDKSLTAAYNEVLKKTKPDHCDIIIAFIHHDIKIKTQGWGKNLLNIFNNNEVDILGVAGTDHLRAHGVWWLDDQGQFNKTDLWGKVWHTDGKKQWASNFSGEKKCNKVQPVVAIDGVFIAINPATCIDFDEEFAGFHLYDISFCVENMIHGLTVGVTETIQLVHESGGQLSVAWEENRAKLCRIYQQHLPMRINYEKEKRESD